MHKENILMTVELKELWSLSRTVLMALKCSFGKRVKSGRLGNQGWAPWNRHSRGPTASKVESRCMGCTGWKEILRYYMWEADLGRRSELEGIFQASLTFPKLGSAVTRFLAKMNVRRGLRTVGKYIWDHLINYLSYSNFTCLRLWKLLQLTKICI